MKTIAFTLNNAHGLHARPASMMVETAKQYESTISIIKEGKQYNGKSMIGLMKMGASQGDSLVIEIQGSDEAGAETAIQALIDKNFDE